MIRRELIQLGASILGTIGAPVAFVERKSAAAAATATTLDDTYLAKGLAGMARAKGWFNAHWGAAVICGYYLCKENNLPPNTALAIQKQLDAMIDLQAAQFATFPAGTGQEELIDQIPAALSPAVDGGLRAHGHAVIFASLATRALRDAPQLAQPELVDKLTELSQQISKLKPERPKGETGYANSQTMVVATFDSLLRFKGLLGRPSIRRPNFTHMVTHTEALLNLEAMGFVDLAQRGYLGHRAHIAAPVPAFELGDTASANNSASFEETLSTEYWAREENIAHWSKQWNLSENPNGYWVAFGHLFKVLYAYHRLIKQINDPHKVRLCSQILLERYFNPAVQGG